MLIISSSSSNQLYPLLSLDLMLKIFNGSDRNKIVCFCFFYLEDKRRESAKFIFVFFVVNELGSIVRRGVRELEHLRLQIQLEGWCGVAF